MKTLYSSNNLFDECSVSKRMCWASNVVSSSGEISSKRLTHKLEMKVDCSHSLCRHIMENFNKKQNKKNSSSHQNLCPAGGADCSGEAFSS